jgi:hypothetical protein
MAVSAVQNTINKLWVPRRDEQGSDITWQPVERKFKDKMGQPRKYDLFGFADYLYMEDKALVAVQIGGPGTHKAHREKILAEPRARQWLGCGNRIELITWSKRKIKRGGKVAEGQAVARVRQPDRANHLEQAQDQARRQSDGVGAARRGNNAGGV